MYSLYRIVNKISGRFYIGVTKNPLWLRFSQHKYAAKIGKKTILYDAMRSYGSDAFKIELLETFCTKEECLKREIELIAQNDNLYNLASGGEGGFNVTNINQWKRKLSKARQGGQPFLGKKHTEETKIKCAEASRKRWASERARCNEPS